MIDTQWRGKEVRIAEDAFNSDEAPDVLALRGQEGCILDFFADGTVMLAIGAQNTYVFEQDLEEIETG